MDQEDLSENGVHQESKEDLDSQDLKDHQESQEKTACPDIPELEENPVSKERLDHPDQLELSDHRDLRVKVVLLENEVILVLKGYKENLVFPGLLAKKDLREIVVHLAHPVVLDHQVFKDILDREVNKDQWVLLD